MQSVVINATYIFNRKVQEIKFIAFSVVEDLRIGKKATILGLNMRTGSLAAHLLNSAKEANLFIEFKRKNKGQA